jgi:hypothetical protein
MVEASTLMDLPIHMSMCKNDRVCSSEKAIEFFSLCRNKRNIRNEYDREHDLLSQDVMPEIVN